MLNFKLFRGVGKYHNFKQSICTSCRRFDKNDSTEFSQSNDDEKERKSREEAKIKLQKLLNTIVNESHVEKSSINITNAVKRVVDKRPIHKVKLDKIKDGHVVKMVSAVKDVADDIGGDVKQTEVELLHVLLNNNKPETLTSSKTVCLNELMTNMKIEKDETPRKARMVGRAEQVRQTLKFEGKVRQPHKTDQRTGERVENRVNLFASKPLGIFNEDFVGKPAEYTLDTWSRLEQKELKLLVTHPPRNIYEEMILWTEQGKLWHFPLDNEQGLEDEKKVDFTEHVFLDEYLESWCPSRGPIRHFMELVLVGLSKNPYITVEAKKQHILWFRDYFEEKKKLLTEVGALGGQSKSQPEENKLA